MVPKTDSDVTNQFRGIDFLLVVSNKFRLYCTVAKLCDIFGGALNLAVIFPLKQTFVNLIPEMAPSPSFFDCTLYVLPNKMRILDYQALGFISFVSR
jgi:hypothetical protein